jgi:hypothetical protein
MAFWRCPRLTQNSLTTPQSALIMMILTSVSPAMLAGPPCSAQDIFQLICRVIEMGDVAIDALELASIKFVECLSAKKL